MEMFLLLLFGCIRPWNCKRGSHAVLFISKSLFWID